MNESPAPTPASKKSKRLRLIGVAVLVLGILSAIIVYWHGKQASAYKDDESMTGYNRSERRQMGQLYGRMGTMIEDLQEDLKDPGTQAEIIIAVTALAAVGCFYFAALADNREEPADPAQT